MKMTLVLAAVLATATLACSRDARTTNPAVAAANRAARSTLTGCLVSGDQPDIFLLRLPGAADAAATGTSGSAPSPASDATGGRTYMIESDTPKDLTGLVNTRVAVNGYVEHLPSPGTSESGAAAPVGTSGSGAQVLRAESVRKIDDRCADAGSR